MIPPIPFLCLYIGFFSNLYLSTLHSRFSSQPAWKTTKQHKHINLSCPLLRLSIYSTFSSPPSFFSFQMQGLIGTLFLSLFYIWSIAVEAPRQETTIAVAVWLLFETLAFPPMIFLFRFFRMAVSNFTVQRLGRIKQKWLITYECCMNFLFWHGFSSFVFN